MSNGYETTVSLRDVAPCGRSDEPSSIPDLVGGDNAINNKRITNHQNHQQQHFESLINEDATNQHSAQHETVPYPKPFESAESSDLGDQSNSNENGDNPVSLRRSKRISKPRDLFADSAHSSI